MYLFLMFCQYGRGIWPLLISLQVFPPYDGVQTKGVFMLTRNNVPDWIGEHQILKCRTWLEKLRSERMRAWCRDMARRWGNAHFVIDSPIHFVAHSVEEVGEVEAWLEMVLEPWKKHDGIHMRDRDLASRRILPEHEIESRLALVSLRKHRTLLERKLDVYPLQISWEGTYFFVEHPGEIPEIIAWLESELARLEALPVPAPPKLSFWKVAA